MTTTAEGFGWRAPGGLNSIGCPMLHHPHADRAAALARAVAFTVALLATAGPAAAEPFISRSLNLAPGQLELGLGAGVGHLSPAADTGAGINVEGRYGLLPRLELGLRTGVRFGDGRALKADEYGRPVETETHNAGAGAVANPEVKLRAHLFRRARAEMSLDAGVQLPVNPPMGVMAALPLALWLGERVRLDTGVYMAVRFFDDTAVDISLPAHLWIQAGASAFAGPIAGVVWQNDAPARLPLGAGAGVTIGEGTDLRAWFLFRDVNSSQQDDVGGGLGVYLRL